VGLLQATVVLSHGSEQNNLVVGPRKSRYSTGGSLHHHEREAEHFNMSQKAPGQRSKDVSVDKMLTFPTFPKLHRSSEAMIWNL
jgi:hypothetical protein